MTSLRIVGPLLTAVLLGSAACAQSDDWQTLNVIPLGTKIKVKLKHKRTFGHCQLDEVTDDWLACDYATGYQRYPRREVRTVSVGHHTARTGFLVGGTAGAILGATNRSSDQAGRVFYAIILTPVVGGIGAGMGAMIDPFLRGRAVYRSPDSGASAGQQPRPSRNQPNPAQATPQR